MSRHCKSALSLLRRCVAVRQIPAPTTTSPPSTTTTIRPGSGFFQQRTWTWTSETRSGCYAQRLSRIQSAVRSSQIRLCSKAPCEDEYPPLPDYQADLDQRKKEVYIVQVTGLPWSCSAQDVLKFFSDCRICNGTKGIHFTPDSLGRPSGRAFIEMEHEEDVNRALEKHRQYLGPRYVEVFEVTNKDVESILKKAVDDNNNNSSDDDENHNGANSDNWVVRLRGLPFTCTEAEITQFFSGLEIAKDGITIITNLRGRRSGGAFVEFTSQEAADAALQRDREVIGNRYIEVFPSRREEIHSTWRRRTSSAPPQNRFQPESSTSSRSSLSQVSTVTPHHIHVRGLPFQVSGVDIVRFFSPIAVSRILIEYGPDGRPNGEADVYFGCHQDAVAAMSRDKQYMGERYVELYLNSIADCERR